MRRRFINQTKESNISFDYNDYLTIEALEDGLSVIFQKDLEYGIDGVGWTYLHKGESTPIINAGQTISFRSRLIPEIYTGVGTFSISKSCNLVGNCMSLIFGDNAANNKDLTNYPYAFRSLFRECNIKHISQTFLPATILAEYCYQQMFSNCTSLITAPELPATTLANSCYCYMFSNCRKLNYIKMLAIDISALNCLNYWVVNVSRIGTFVKSKDATWDVGGVSGIPSNWKIEYDHNYDIGSDISFHIERIDETLYAKDWMTWDDWVHSKYNTVSALISSYKIQIPSYSSYPLATPDNIIKNGGTYYFGNTDGGSSD